MVGGELVVMKKLVAVLVLMLILTGCSGSDEPVSTGDTLTEIVNPDTNVTVTETPVITDTPIETTPEITVTPEPTLTPIPTETPTPVPGQKFGFEVYNAKYDNGQGYIFNQEYWLMDTWIDSRDSESVKEACEKIHIDVSRLDELLSQYPSEYRKDGHYMYVFGYISSENITEGRSLSEDNTQDCGCRMESSLVKIEPRFSLDMYMVGFFFDNETLKKNAIPIPLLGSQFVVFADNTYTDTLSWSQSKDKVDIPIVFVAYSEDDPDYPQGNPWYEGIVISVYDKTAVEYISHKPMIPEMGKNRYKVKDDSKSCDFSDVSVGDTITFGAYEQDNNFENGSEPVEWIVIGKEDDKLLILSKNILDNSCFSYMLGYTWEKCYLRSWLNSMFYDCCFSSKEKDMIKETSLTDKDGNVTMDKVFLLSKEEAESLDDSILEAVPSEYASPLWMQSRLWVLRTSDQDGAAACSVLYSSYDESAYFNDYTVSYLNIFGVRPAMYIKINDKK